MSLQILSPPLLEPVSLADVKAHLRVTHSDEDSLINACAIAARRAVEARGGIAFIAQSWRLTLDRAPAGLLTLPRTPVFSVDDVAIVDREGVAASVDADLYDVETGTIGRLIARGPWPWTVRQISAVRIDFTAGWPLAADVPDELKLAIKMLAGHFYENREGVTAERVFAVPQAIDALIAPYRQVRL